MPADSTPDSAPEETAPLPAAGTSEAAESLPSQPAEKACGVPETAVHEPDSAAVAAWMDKLDPDHDMFRQLAGLGAMVREFSNMANVAVAPALLPVLQLPNVVETIRQPLMDVLGPRGVTQSWLAGVQPQVLSLSETVGSVLQSSFVPTLGGVLDGISPAKAVLSAVQPQIADLAGVLGPAARLSSIADSLQPLAGLGELVRQSHVGLAPALKGLSPLFHSLPNMAKVAEVLAPTGFVALGLSQMVQDALRIRLSLADLIGGHVAGLFAGMRSFADWAMQLEQSVLAEARYAFGAYLKGDKEPMKEFLHRGLRLWPVLEDHCQALAVAMFERSWEQEADLTDDRSVRSVLRRYARQGCDFERDHQIRGASVGYIPDGWEQQDTRPGPEDLVFPRVVPWAQQFETEPVRYVLKRLNEQEQAVVRVWSENNPVRWPTASALVRQEAAHGERARRKLRSLGKSWRESENNGRKFS
jgi:hypothetical protein